MAEKRKLLQRYMQCLNEMQDELQRKELAKKMETLEKLQCELARRQEQGIRTQGAGQSGKLERRQYLKDKLKSYQKTLNGLLCELARREAFANGERGRVSESDNLPHPLKLDEFTVSFRYVG